MVNRCVYKVLLSDSGEG